MLVAALAACLLAISGVGVAGADADCAAGGAGVQVPTATGTVTCTYGEVIKPAGVEEVQRIVKEAREAGRRVRALGCRHSIHDIICTGRDGDVAIEMGGFDGVEVAADRKTATLGAGAVLNDAMVALEDKGVAMLVVPALGELTVAGAMATGAHGSSLVHPSSLSDQAVAVTLVDGRGEVVVAEGEVLKSAALHLGVLGVVVNVTLPVRDLVKLRLTNTVVDEAVLYGQAVVESARSADILNMIWVPGLKKMMLMEGVAVPPQSEGDFRFPASISDQAAGEDLLAHAERNASFFCDKDARFLMNATLTGRFQNMVAFLNCGASCGAMSTRWQNLAVAVDLGVLPAAMRRMRQVLDATGLCVPAMGIRFHTASENHMSMAWGAEKAVFDLLFPIPEEPDLPVVFLGAAQAMYQVLTHEFGGVPHWGKNGPAFWSGDVPGAAERFPRLEDFLDNARRMDPDGVFRNAFFSRALGEAEVEKVPGCALTAKCVCDEDEHCGRDQTCVAPLLPQAKDIGLPDLKDSRSKVRICQFALRVPQH